MISIIHEVFREHSITIPFIALAVAIVLKWIIGLLKWKFSVARMLGSGGMPSAHSTFVTSLAATMFLKHGFFSDEFLMSIVFSIIIIYDALNVRYQAGLHAQLLNEIIAKKDIQLNESIGHLPSEAIVWSIIGALTALALLGI